MTAFVVGSCGDEETLRKQHADMGIVCREVFVIDGDIGEFEVGHLNREGRQAVRTIKTPVLAYLQEWFNFLDNFRPGRYGKYCFFCMTLGLFHKTLNFTGRIY